VIILAVAYSDQAVNLKAIFASLVAALEVSDPYTRGHSDRVGTMAVAMGWELGLEIDQIEILQDAGTLHDIGKIGISKEVLNKPGKLTPEEFELIKQHPVLGCTILGPLGLKEVLEITRWHHERLDGKGYPDGITDYPLLVRITQLADVWDALTSDRPYRAGMRPMKARELMGNPAEFGFDPGLTETFLRLTRAIYPDDDCEENELETALAEIEAAHLEKELEGLEETEEE
jgi:HD-GYP domain-containing protein (c-di-GMP phosphodiesterase class II)